MTIDTSEPHHRSSLSTQAARKLATTTKSVPQMQGITSRWLLRVLPWVQADGGAYRVNRRLAYTLGDGRVSFSSTGSQLRVVPPELGELPLLRGFSDASVLSTLADRFTQREYHVGETIVTAGQPADQLFLLAHGKVRRTAPSKYGAPTMLGVLADGEFFGQDALVGDPAPWEHTMTAATSCVVLSLSRQVFQDLLSQHPGLRGHVEGTRSGRGLPTNRYGEAAVEVASGHTGEPELPRTFVDYELEPREYELAVAQTVLRVHTRVADLYNHPMNQVEEQLRLTIEALRERQEHEMLNNSDFGLLHNVDPRQRVHTQSGPPTPDDLDELLSRRRKTQFLLAHPRAIAAFGRECSHRGIYPSSVDLEGHAVPAWRGVPILPCNKIPVTADHTSTIVAIRTGEADQGVIGLHQTGIPDEYRPGLSVRFMGIDTTAVMSYLVSAYYSVAVLVPDALGVLEDVEIGRYEDV